MAFRLQQRLLAGDILASSIAWEGEHVSKSADEVLAERDAAVDAPSRVEAEEFLQNALAAGSRPSRKSRQTPRTPASHGEPSREQRNRSVSLQRALPIRARGQTASRPAFGGTGGCRRMIASPRGPSLAQEGHVPSVAQMGFGGPDRALGRWRIPALTTPPPNHTSGC